jgi:hypothetical protein
MKLDNLLDSLLPTTKKEWKLLLLAQAEHNRLLVEEYKDELAQTQWFLLESRASKKYIESKQFKKLAKYNKKKNKQE